MKYVIKFCLERILETNVDNFNEAFSIAEKRKKEGEVIVSIRSR